MQLIFSNAQKCSKIKVWNASFNFRPCEGAIFKSKNFEIENKETFKDIKTVMNLQTYTFSLI